jgi:aldose 1-epimerase
MTELVRLQSDDLTLLLDPATGGAIQRFTMGGEDVFYPLVTPALTAQRGARLACYPQMPYANRIAFGCFGFGIDLFRLALNFANHPHSMHGNAWMHPWQLVSHDMRSCVLRFAHEPRGIDDPEWPFPYVVTQSFGLSRTGLLIGMSLTNSGDHAAPFGMGLHPAIARSHGCTLSFGAKSIWRNGPDMLPEREDELDSYCDFSDPVALIDADFFDNCFAGWDGEARITWPEKHLSLRMSADGAFSHLQVFTPPGQDFFCLEPVTHRPDAVNCDPRAAGAMRILAPGETLSGTIGFTLARIS